MRTLQCAWRPRAECTCSCVIMLSSGVLADELVFGFEEDNVHRHQTSWLLITALPPQKPLWTVWVTRMVSWHFLGISTYVLLDSTTSTTSFFLCGLLALLLIPSIHFPTHPLIHSSIHTSTHHPSTQVPIHPGTDGWMNERMGEWMGGWMDVRVSGRADGWSAGWLDA